MTDEKLNEGVEKTNFDMTMEYVNRVISESKVEKPKNWGKKETEHDEAKHEDLQSIMNKMCDNNHRIGIEFNCGECCKKVTNAAKIFFIFGHVILLPIPCESLVLKAFSGGRLVDKQFLRAVIVPVERVCSIEVERDNGRKA